MNRIQKACIRLTVLLTLTTAMLSASQYDNRLVSCEKLPVCCEAPSFCLPPCYFFARGDVLYWTPRITGLELNFGSTSVAQTVIDETQILATNEVDLDPHFKWDTGCRAGVGFSCNKIGAEVLWTHFQGNGSRSNHQHLGIVNSGRVSIKLDQIDAVLAYNVVEGSAFNCKPFFGVRGARIHQHVRATLFTDIALFALSTAREIKTLDNRQKYWGIGPLFGLQGDWEIGCGFGIYGTAAASVLYGEYKLHLENDDIFSAPISKKIFSNNKRHVHCFDYNIDLALGLTWHITMCDRFEVDMKLGFEQHQYFNQNHFVVGRGDVSFVGGVFSLAIGF